MQNYIRIVIVVTVFSILSFLGSLVKLGGAASIALDSWVSFFVAAYFGPLSGGLVGLLGHLITAATGGFPFSPAVHALVALLQFVWAFAFGVFVQKFNSILGFVGAGLFVVLCNGIAAPFLIGLVFPNLKTIMIDLMPVLIIASAVNVTIAIAVVYGVKSLRPPA